MFRRRLPRKLTPVVDPRTTSPVVWSDEVFTDRLPDGRDRWRRVATGVPWRLLPNDFPPWQAVCQQAARWDRAGVFKTPTRNPPEFSRQKENPKEGQTRAGVDPGTPESTPQVGSESRVRRSRTY